MSPGMFSALGLGHQRDLEDLLGVMSPGDSGQQEGSLEGSGAESPGKERAGIVRTGTPAMDNNGVGIMADVPATEAEHPPAFMAATLQQYQGAWTDPGRPLTTAEVQRLTWSDFFRIIKSLQFHLQTLSVLGTRARVRPFLASPKGKTLILRPMQM